MRINEITRRRIVWLGAIALLVAIAALLGPWGAEVAYAAPPTDCLGQGGVLVYDNPAEGEKIYFVEANYDDPVSGQSSWFYCVESGSGPAISHVTFEVGIDCLLNPANVIEAGTWGPTTNDRNNGDGAPTVGTDATTGVTGIKFDQGFADGEARNYYFTLQNNYALDYITVALKSGGDEDYANEVPGPSGDCDLEADWGDLPDPTGTGMDYQNTVLLDNGARHYFLPTGDVILGTLRDADFDGQESLASNGDDLSTSDDEDGVVMDGSQAWNAGNGGAVFVTATGGAGCVSAWLDYNPADGIMSPGEQILNNVLVPAGTTNVPFPLSGTPSGGIYARFRLVPAVGGSCDGVTAPGLTGPADGGEVEDYLWNFSPTAVTLQTADTSSPSMLPLWPALMAISMILASAAVLRRQPVEG